MKKNSIITKVLAVSLLVALAVSWRIINHEYTFAPNLELITTVSVLAAILFGARYGLLTALSSMIISDMIIGNSSIFIVTWSAFALIGLSAGIMRKFNKQSSKQVMMSVGFAIISSFTFFAVTNLGVWLQGWYPMTWAGFSTCFINAIPFYRTMIIGNLILVPAAVSAYQFARIKFEAKSPILADK